MANGGAHPQFSLRNVQQNERVELAKLLQTGPVVLQTASYS